MGVGPLYLFGPIVQGEVEPDCVIDILVELARPMDFFGFLEIEERIGERLQQPVHLITPDVLRPTELEQVLGEAVLRSNVPMRAAWEG